MKYDVIIIGGGLGGLECGMILARAGKKVLVLEQGKQVGGCLQSYKRNGLTFDTGFHYVGGLEEGQAMHHAFRYLGLLDLPWKRMDEYFDQITMGNQHFAFAQGYETFAHRLTTDFPAERNGLKKYATLLKEIEAHSLDGLKVSADMSDFPTSLFDINAYQYLQETFHDPLLIEVLGGTSLKMELRKESLPLFTFAHGNSGFIGSSWRLKGSGSLLANKLTEGIRAQGGDVVCNTEVEALEEKDGLLTGVRCTDGRTFEGTSFISAIHPASTCRLLGQSKLVKKAYRSRLSHQTNTFGMCTVSLSIKPGKLVYFNNNHYVYREANAWTYPGNNIVDRILVSCRIPEDGSEYTRQVDLLTPMTWDKCLPWEQTTVGRRGNDYQAWKGQVADACMDLAECCLPGLKDMVEKRYISTPLTYRDYTLAPEGTAYGLRKDSHAPLGGMLSPRTPIPNLFLAGQNLILHGIQGVTMTSLFTCSEIVGKDWIRRHVVEGHS